MIGYLYNLSLDEVNRVISEINLELKGTNNKSISPAQEYNDIIAHVTVGVPSTELVVDGLHLHEKEIWHFDAHIKNGNNTPSYYIFINNDKKATSYHEVNIITTHGVAVNSATRNDSLFATMSADDIFVVNGRIVVMEDSKEVFVFYESYRKVADVFQTGVLRYTMESKDNEIFKMVISSSVEKAMTKGSSLRISEF